MPFSSPCHEADWWQQSEQERCSKAHTQICIARLPYHPPLLARCVHESEAVTKDDGTCERCCQANGPDHNVRDEQRLTSKEPITVLQFKM
jgi:hypothetical protein